MAAKDRMLDKQGKAGPAVSLKTQGASRIVGVISDTHRLMRLQALAALADSELIIHAGNVGKSDVNNFDLDPAAAEFDAVIRGILIAPRSQRGPVSCF